MTNIWADTYKQIRDPFFQIEDPYTVSEEKKEKKEKEESDEKKNEKEDEKEDDKPKRWWDDDGDGKGYEKGEVSGKFSKKKVKEERDLYSKTNKNDKLDVRKDLKNKINTKPSVSEEIEAWVDELISEGYDLSKFTWEEVAAIYEGVELDEGNTSTMPPRGDAETVKVDPMAAAKAKAARAKVTKEIADLQVAKQAQRTKVSTTESVFTFIENRYDLSEAVFNPKRDKMRPAAERTQKVMTDAQRKAAKAKEARAEKLESEADKILNTMKGGPARRSSAPMGSTRSEKPGAPEANRKLGKGKQDTLASKANKVLKDIQNK